MLKPKESELYLFPDHAQLEYALKQVREETWGKWADVFEHKGPIKENPILASKNRFDLFCFAWGVGRTIRKNEHEKLRHLLLTSKQFADAIKDKTGGKITTLMEDLREDFGAINKRTQRKTSLVSALSKLAAFMRPERFVAWDYYARCGLNLVSGRPKTRPFKNYADYLSHFDKAWNGQPGERIRVFMKCEAKGIEAEPRFQRRVLDLYLMNVGRKACPRAAAKRKIKDS